jgi:hypothetical protein
MYVAQYVDYGIGGHDNSSNNFASFDSTARLFIAQCSASYGQPGNWSPVGVLGITMLATPDAKGMTGVRTFAVHTYDLDNDERNWTVISSSGVGLANTMNVNAAGLLSSGPFRLLPGGQKQMLIAYIFANDTASLRSKAALARQFYESGFDDSILEGVQSKSGSPRVFFLEQNYPNPFNPATTIRFALPHRSHVILTVFNTLGQPIANLVNSDVDAGNHEVRFDGSNLASGVYFYRLRAGDFSGTKRFVILK